jgi:HEAT repeat protein
MCYVEWNPLRAIGFEDLLMIRFACPKCDTSLKSSEDKAGTKTTCPRCGERLQVPSVDDVETDEQAPKRAPVKGKNLPAAKAGKRKGEEQDVDELEEVAEQKKTPIGLYVGIGIAVCAVVGIGGAVIGPMLFAPKPGLPMAGGIGKPPPPPTAPPIAQPTAPPKAKPAPTTPAKPAEAAKPSGSSQSPDSKPPIKAPESAPTPTETRPAEPVPETPVAMDPGSVVRFQRPNMYKQLLKSTCWCVTILNNAMITGSGSLVDKQNKLVLTNYHVIKSHAENRETKLLVFFPLYEGKDRLISEKDQYLERAQRSEAGLPGWIAYQDPKRDLALIRLQDLPAGVQPIRLSRDPVTAGDQVYSLGSPGGSGALWSFTTGIVRSQPYHRHMKVGAVDPNNPKVVQESIDLDARVVETATPTNPGDSGGPLVNERGDLVAVTESVQVGANSMSCFVDVSEVRNILAEYYKSKSLVPPVDTATAPAEVAADVPTLIKALERGPTSRKIWAAENLGKIGPDAKAAVPALVKAVDDKNDMVRKAAADALIQVGSLTQGDVPMLLDKMLQDANPDVRLAATLVLKTMGSEADSAVDGFTKALKDKDARVRLEAMNAIIQLGPTAKSAAPELIKLLAEDHNADSRAQAALALSKIGPEPREVIPTLEHIVKKDPVKDVRLNALTAIEALGNDAKPTLPVLMVVIKEKDREIRKRTIAALGALGPAAAPALELIMPSIQEGELRPTVCDTLAKIGKPAVKPLMIYLLHTNSDIRLAAVETMGNIGTDAKVAIPTLMKLSTRDIVPIQEAAREALKKILGKAATG